MAKSMKVAVDQRFCGSIGLCVREAPELFRFQPGSKRAIADDAEVPSRLRGRVRSLANRCPYHAIVIDESGGAVRP